MNNIDILIQSLQELEQKTNLLSDCGKKLALANFEYKKEYLKTYQDKKTSGEKTTRSELLTSELINKNLDKENIEVEYTALKESIYTLRTKVRVYEERWLNELPQKLQ